MEIKLNTEKPFSTKIKILGVGGAGGNAVNSMVNSKIFGVEFIAANTDAQDLHKSLATTKIHLGAKLTKGLGAGADPEKGKRAAEESLDEITEAICDADMLFITAGMGGGTGTGGAPVIAKKAKELGILTLGIVSLPFDFEGQRRKENAAKGIKEIQDVVDTLIVIPNTKLAKITGKLPFYEAFKKADDIATNAANAIADIINRSGYINVDFADVKTVMTNGGYALMGIGIAEGEDRAKKAANDAIFNPLLSDIELTGCRGLLVNVAAGPDMLMDEFDEINETITNETGKNGTIITGMTIDEKLHGKIKVTIIATGLIPSDAVATLPEEKVIPTIVTPKPTAKPTFIKDIPPYTEKPMSELDQALENIRNNTSTPIFAEVKPASTVPLHTTDFKQGEPPAFMKKYFN